VCVGASGRPIKGPVSRQITVSGTMYAAGRRPNNNTCSSDYQALGGSWTQMLTVNADCK
jgi:hypothetical protein